MPGRAEQLTGIAGLNLSADELHHDPWNIFSKPSLETNIVRDKIIEINPISAITDDGPYEYLVPSYDLEYCSLPKTVLTGTIQILKDNGDPCTATEDVSLVNLWPNSLFKQVEVYVNGVQVQDQSTATYGIKSYVETALSFGNAAKNSVLKTCHFYKEKIGTEDTNKEAGADADSGYMKRKEDVKESKKAFFITDTYVDLFKTHTYLPSGVNLKIRYFRQNDEFSLMHDGTKNYKIKILDLKLRFKKQILKPDLISRHLGIFERGGLAAMTYQSHAVSTHTIPIGTSTINIPDIASGPLPSQCLIGFISDEAFNGNVKLNPYKFEHIDVNYWNFRVNGASVPTIPFKPDFSEPKGEVMLLYQNLLDAIGIGRENTQMDLTPEDFCANLPLFAIDLSGDGCNNYKIHLGTSGTLNINASLKKPTDKVWQLVKFLTYPKCLTIDKDRICKVEDLF